MKMFKISLSLFLSLFVFQVAGAQSVLNDSIKVNGNCNMCKKIIEKSALAAGAETAKWDKKTKYLYISYDPNMSANTSIQKAVAQSGYDTKDFTAPDSAYYKLEECCQYQRGFHKQ